MLRTVIVMRSLSFWAVWLILLFCHTSTGSTYGHCGDWLFRSNPEDCSTYYQCNFGVAILRHCSDGLHWNNEFQTCDWSKSAGCEKSLILPDTEQIEGYNVESGSNAIGNGLLKDSRCMENGKFISNPKDCSSYFVCSHGSHILMQCAGGLHWNPTINNCDWPANANCQVGGGGSVTEETTSSTTLTPIVVSTVQPPASTTVEIITGPPTTESSTPVPTTTTTSSSTVGPPAPPDGIIIGPPSPPSSPTDRKVICYFTDWAFYRPGQGKYLPSNVDASLCTNIVYSFGLLDSETWTIKPADTWVDYENKFYEQITALKSTGTKVSLAIGGWNDSGGDKYSRLISDPAKRAIFINSVKKFLKDHNFDGLDMDWEYPGCPQGNCNHGSANDKPNFSALIKELRAALPDKLLSAAVSCNKNVVDRAYDVPVANEYLDWIGVMTYDINGHWNKKTGHNSPLYYNPGDDYDYLNSHSAITYWVERGASPHKLILGVPMYAQTFTLADPNQNALYDPTIGPGLAGQFTRQKGMLAYYEICAQTWTAVARNSEYTMGPYAYKGNQWISYDDVTSIKIKMDYVKEMELGGAMIWALDLDDFRGSCGQGKYPLLTAMFEALRV